MSDHDTMAHPPSRLQFAFPHSKGGDWWLTDGYGYSRKVSRVVWLYYRTTRHWRWRRFNREASSS